MFPPKSFFFPEYHKSISFPFRLRRFLMAPVGADDLAVQDHVRGALGQGALERLAQSGCPSGQDVDDLVDVPVGRRLRQPESRAEPRDAALVPEPRQAEQRLPVTAQPASLFPGSDRPAAGREQGGNEPGSGQRGRRA